ncbi:uncharacterized protein TNCV_832601 [Trichonephila clavipes]|nr:uncharacterized protein TNCV_832601 [Trichonephila clavipes]
MEGAKCVSDSPLAAAELRLLTGHAFLLICIVLICVLWASGQVIQSLSCIKGDAEEGLKPELDEKADVLDVEGSLLGIGFTGGHSDIIAAIGGVDVKRSA